MSRTARRGRAANRRPSRVGQLAAPLLPAACGFAGATTAAANIRERSSTNSASTGRPAQPVTGLTATMSATELSDTKASGGAGAAEPRAGAPTTTSAPRRHLSRRALTNHSTTLCSGMLSSIGNRGFAGAGLEATGYSREEDGRFRASARQVGGLEASGGHQERMAPRVEMKRLGNAPNRPDRAIDRSLRGMHRAACIVVHLRHRTFPSDMVRQHRARPDGLPVFGAKQKGRTAAAPGAPLRSGSTDAATQSPAY